MTKPSATWHQSGPRAFKLTLWILLAVLPAVALAGDPKAAGKSAGQTVLGKYGSSSGFNNNISQPITSSVTPMTTVDGTVSGSGQITAPSSNVFVEVAVQPMPSGDLGTVQVYQDLDFNGSYEYSYAAPAPVSGVCANGVISCTPGTWTDCTSFGWTANASGQALLTSIPLDDLGGCYCINASCGSDLVWSNLGLVLKDLGGGVLGAVQSQQPAFVVTDVKTEDVIITYYGMDTASSGKGVSGMPLVGSVEATKYYNNPGSISGDTEDVLLAQATDPNSYYSLAVTSLKNRSEPGSLFTCTVERTIDLPTDDAFCSLADFDGETRVVDDVVSYMETVGDKVFVREGDRESGGAGITFRDIALTTVYRGPMRTDAWKAVSLHAIYDASTNSSRLQVKRAYTPGTTELGSELAAAETRIRLYDSTGKEVSDLMLVTVSSVCVPVWIDDHTTTCSWEQEYSFLAGGWRKSLGIDNKITLIGTSGSLLGWIVFEGSVCPLAGGSACFGLPLHCTMYSFQEGEDDSCLALENDPDCTLRDEKVDDVYTYKTFNPTGLAPLPSCRDFDLPEPWLSTTYCRDWWLKERVYMCKGVADFDFTDAKKRIASINGTVDGVDPTAGEVHYTDMRSEPGSGVWTTDSQTLKWDVPEPGAACQVVCKTKKVVSDAEVNMSGPVTLERVEGTQNEFFFKACDGAVCPTEPGEEIVKPCQCVNEFVEAATAMSSIKEAGKDMICSSGVKK